MIISYAVAVVVILALDEQPRIALLAGGIWAAVLIVGWVALRRRYRRSSSGVRS